MDWRELECIMVGVAMSGILSFGLALFSPDKPLRIPIDRGTLAWFGLGLTVIGFGVGAIVGGLS